jgi:uncharacterized protein YdeI (YjbR/CyaY-like superfamily)
MASTPLYFKDRDEWRIWLEQHYKSESGVWLLFYKKHAEKIGVSYTVAVEEALCFGWIDSTLKSIDKEKHMIKFSPRKQKSVWSKINKEKAEMLIASGKMMPAGLEKIEEAKRNGLWHSAYTNKVKEKMPLDLKQALQKNPAAWEYFQGLANSYRNMYIGWINSAKTKETRKKRLREVVLRSSKNMKPGV